MIVDFKVKAWKRFKVSDDIKDKVLDELVSGRITDGRTLEEFIWNETGMFPKLFFLSSTEEYISPVDNHGQCTIEVFEYREEGEEEQVVFSNEMNGKLPVQLEPQYKSLLLHANSGTFLERFDEIVEHVYVDDSDWLRKFCTYLDEEIGGAGSANIELLYLAFRNPSNLMLQEQAQEIKSLIEQMKSY